jgi:hypothetical protein
VQAHKTAAGTTDPQHSRATFIQRDYRNGAETRHIPWAQNSEAFAIEAGEPSECAYPEIAVVILRQRIHGVLGQSLLRLPDSGEVLRRIRLCVNGNYEETGQQTCGNNNCDLMLACCRRIDVSNSKAVRQRRNPQPGEIRQPLLRNYSSGSEPFCRWNKFRLKLGCTWFCFSWAATFYHLSMFESPS